MEELVEECNRLGITLRIGGDKLIAASASALTPELSSRIREHKADLIKLLRPSKKTYRRHVGPHPYAEYLRDKIMPKNQVGAGHCYGCNGTRWHERDGWWFCDRCFPTTPVETVEAQDHPWPLLKREAKLMGIEGRDTITLEEIGTWLKTPAGRSRKKKK